VKVLFNFIFSVSANSVVVLLPSAIERTVLFNRGNLMDFAGLF